MKAGPACLAWSPSMMKWLSDEGKIPDAIYLNFSEAYDTVSTCVLKKLAAPG